MEEFDSSILRLCKISMCPPKENTDIDYLLDNSGAFNDIDNPEYFVVEFGTSSPVITVSVDQEINLDDIICYMKGVPVKSQIHGKITEVADRYIIGQYIVDSDITEEEIKNKFNLN